MIQIAAKDLKPGFIICKRAGGRFCKIVSVAHGVNIVVKYDDQKLDVFDQDQILNVRK